MQDLGGRNVEPLQASLYIGWKHIRLFLSYIGCYLVKESEQQFVCYTRGVTMIITATFYRPSYE